MTNNADLIPHNKPATIRGFVVRHCTHTMAKKPRITHTMPEKARIYRKIFVYNMPSNER